MDGSTPLLLLVRRERVLLGHYLAFPLATDFTKHTLNFYHQKHTLLKTLPGYNLNFKLLPPNSAYVFQSLVWETQLFLLIPERISTPTEWKLFNTKKVRSRWYPARNYYGCRLCRWFSTSCKYTSSNQISAALSVFQSSYCHFNSE